MTRKHPRVQIHFDDEPMTKQYFKDECNVNNIVRRFQQDGVIPVTTNVAPQYGHAPNLEFKEALDLVLSGRQEFASLSDSVRQGFGNDENRYFQFLDTYQRDPTAYDALLSSPSGASGTTEGSEEVSDGETGS